MSEIIEFFITSYQNFGIQGILISFVAIFIFGILYEMAKQLGRKFGKEKLFLNRIIFNQDDLKKHILFDKCDYLIKFRIPQMKIACPLRKKLFTRLLILKIESYKKNINELIENPNLATFTPQKLFQEVTEMFGKINLEWQNKAMDYGIPAIVLEKLQDEIVQIKQFVSRYTESICFSSTAEESNIQKVATIMDFIWTIEEYIISELEKVLNDLNGTISNIRTAEFKCHNCKICKALHKSHN